MSPEQLPWWRSRTGIVTAGFLVAGAFYLLTEHTAHVFGALPYLLLVACPVMHFFHHGGHRHDHGGPKDRADGAAR
jgi:hypothetical protein